MGLDIYVGSLTRYYTGDWELMAFQVARQLGMKVVVARPGESEEKKPDREKVHELVLTWREALGRELAEYLDEPLEWDEGPETPYFTYKPTRTCYTDLLYWAAYDEHPELEMPTMHKDDWKSDPAWKASFEAGGESRYCHLLNDCEWWLPIKLPGTFVAPTPTMRQVSFGSSIGLLRQLEELNGRTWRADEDTIASWKRHCPDFPPPIEPSAKYAYSIALELTKLALIHKLPMLLDY